jgi:hypothetical protein
MCGIHFPRKTSFLEGKEKQSTKNKTAFTKEIEGEEILSADANFSCFKEIKNEWHRRLRQLSQLYLCCASTGWMLLSSRKHLSNSRVSVLPLPPTLVCLNSSL